jgi:hypothetical protein
MPQLAAFGQKFAMVQVLSHCYFWTVAELTDKKKRANIKVILQ